MGLGNKAFQVLSRIPIVGDPLIVANTIRRAVPALIKGEFRRAAAEATSGIAQAVLDDVVPVVGRDLGHELTRLAFGPEYLGPSLILGKLFDKIHQKRGVQPPPLPIHPIVRSGQQQLTTNVPPPPRPEIRQLPPPPPPQARR